MIRQSLAKYSILLLTGLMCANLLPGSSRGQRPTESEVGLNEERFRSELERLASICDQHGLERQALITRSWLIPQRSDQTVLYLPEETGNHSPESALVASWRKHFQAARRSYAKHLFARARALVKSDEQRAYRILWQCLREDPEFQPAQRILGKLTRTLAARPRLNQTNRGTRTGLPHREFGWPAGSYRTVQTPHFELLSRAPPRETIQLARRLEEFYVLWSQRFYIFWARPGSLQERFEGKASEWPETGKLKVVLLADRTEYLRLLGIGEDMIGVSVGYYNPAQKRSYFYPAEDLSSTLHHELTHQLLLEATHINARPEAGTESGIWMLEGIALYMESLRRCEPPVAVEHMSSTKASRWILGGVESPRLQTARYRGIREGYWPAWKRFSSAGMEAWKRDPELATLYSHAAGLTHLFLDELTQTAEDRFWTALEGLYQGDGTRQQQLLTFLGDTEEAAKRNYQKALLVTDQDIRALVAAQAKPQELVLCGSELQAETWLQLRQFRELQWLDLSFSNVEDDFLTWLPQMKSLQRLSFEGTRLGSTALGYVAHLPELRELDLSGCPIDASGIKLLEGHPELETLWLTHCPLDDAVLPILNSLPALLRCDVQGTKIQERSWSAFVRGHPRLQQ